MGRESRVTGAEGWSSSHSREEMARRREPMRGRDRDAGRTDRATLRLLCFLHQLRHAHHKVLSRHPHQSRHCPQSLCHRPERPRLSPRQVPRRRRLQVALLNTQLSLLLILLSLFSVRSTKSRAQSSVSLPKLQAMAMSLVSHLPNQLTKSLLPTANLALYPYLSSVSLQLPRVPRPRAHSLRYRRYPTLLPSTPPSHRDYPLSPHTQLGTDRGNKYKVSAFSAVPS